MPIVAGLALLDSFEDQLQLTTSGGENIRAPRRTCLQLCATEHETLVERVCVYVGYPDAVFEI
jgi:hypothetical protein